MDTTLKQVVAGAVLAGAGFVGGTAGSINASEVTKIDATKAQSVGDVVIEKVITAPTTTVERFTLNDLVSEIEMLDRQIAQLTNRRNSLVAKAQAVQAETTEKFNVEDGKRKAEEIKQKAEEIKQKGEER